VLSPFSRRSQSASCSGDKGTASMLVVGFALRKVEWKLKEMPREVPRPRKAKSVYVALPSPSSSVLPP
jgi:hypothetical protein